MDRCIEACCPPRVESLLFDNGDDLQLISVGNQATVIAKCCRKRRHKPAQTEVNLPSGCLILVYSARTLSFSIQGGSKQEKRCLVRLIRHDDSL
jgi:hypothetical protein